MNLWWSWRWRGLEAGCGGTILTVYWELRPAETDGNTFFEGEVEPCINGGALAVGSCFGRPTESLARRLVGEQLEDGGWNCEAPKSARSSFHTTICVLEGCWSMSVRLGLCRRLRKRGGGARSIWLSADSSGEGLRANCSSGVFGACVSTALSLRVLRALDYFRTLVSRMRECATRCV